MDEKNINEAMPESTAGEAFENSRANFPQNNLDTLAKQETTAMAIPAPEGEIAESMADFPPENNENNVMKKQYWRVCLRLGLYITFLMLLREVGEIVIFLIVNILSLSPDFSSSAMYLIQLSLSCLFLQITPAILGVFLLKYDRDKIRAGYKKPKNNAKALGNLPAAYGLAMCINLLTLWITQLIGGNGYNEAFNPTALNPPDFPSACIMFVFGAIVAPIFEEFVFRGVIISALKPYGKGIAIFASALMFGLMHGNPSQLFYATALGIVLGYIAVVTGGIFTTTIMHAVFNSISCGMMLFIASPSVLKYYGTQQSDIPDGDALVLTMYAIYQLAVVITALLGAVLMVMKLIKIKRYRLPQVWDGLGTWGKIWRLAFNPLMIIAIILTVDIFAGCNLAQQVLLFLYRIGLN